MSDKTANAKYSGGGEEEVAKMETEELNENNDQGTQGSLEGKHDGENDNQVHDHDYQAVLLSLFPPR